MNIVNDVNIEKAKNDDLLPPPPGEGRGEGKTFRLNLDADGVYWGATEIHAEDVQASDVVLDHVPDNPPGKYRWDPAAAALVALPKSQQKEAVTAPDLERAFDALCAWLSDGDEIPLPPHVAEWRAWYEKTIDRKKTAD